MKSAFSGQVRRFRGLLLGLAVIATLTGLSVASDRGFGVVYADGQTREPVDCVTKTSEWSTCTDGVQTRDVTIVEPAKNGGKCELPPTTQACATIPEPIDCEFSVSDWSVCSIGLQTRSILIVKPPQFAGRAICRPRPGRAQPRRSIAERMAGSRVGCASANPASSESRVSSASPQAWCPGSNASSPIATTPASTSRISDTKG